MKDENYISIKWWMMNKFDLKWNELILYAIIYWFSQDWQSQYRWAIQYIMEALNISKATAISLVKRLVNKWLINKTKNTTGSLYSVDMDKINNTKSISFKDRHNKTDRGIETRRLETIHQGSRNYTDMCIETIPNNNINNNNINNNSNVWSSDELTPSWGDWDLTIAPVVINNQQSSWVSKSTKKLFDVDSDEYKIAARYTTVKLEEWWAIVRSLVKKQWLENFIQSWAIEIDKLHRIDWHSYKGIALVIKFVLEDDFWNSQMNSLTFLRKNTKNGIPRFPMLIEKFERQQEIDKKNAWPTW